MAKPGYGKNKGSSFERTICSKLSLWITDGKHRDALWRSSMSGGRATIIRERGGKNRQAGDICAVAPEGHVLTDKYYIECKHVKNIGLESFIIKGKGPIAEWWKTACKQAKQHEREPVLIAKQNNLPIVVFTQPGCMFNPGPVAHLGKCDLGLLDRILATPFAG